MTTLGLAFPGGRRYGRHIFFASFQTGIDVFTAELVRIGRRLGDAMDVAAGRYDKETRDGLERTLNATSGRFYRMFNVAKRYRARMERLYAEERPLSRFEPHLELRYARPFADLETEFDALVNRARAHLKRIDERGSGETE